LTSELDGGVRLLAGVPLFAGIPDEELRELGQLLQPVELQPGDVLCRQGEETNGLHVIVGGSVGVYARLPGEREVELATLDAGEVIGELTLVDGGARAGTVRALEPTSAFFFGRADFLARVARMDPTAFTIKRRLAAIMCERLRRRFAVLSESLGDESDDDEPLPIPLESRPGPAPHDRYLLRLPFFRAFEPPQRARLLDVCRIFHVPSRQVLLRAGDHAEVAYVTVNGAVEEVLGRGRRRIRVRLAGPGLAVGYVGLVDGGPSPVTVATRERAILLAIEATTFAEFFDGATALSHVFLEAVQRDLIGALQQAERPQARLAAALPQP
jgi:CRP-like cAMP-binding protein